MAETEIKSINGRPIADTTARKNKADKTGWGANKYIGTDENGNLVEKDLPETGTGGITQETDPTVPSWAKQPEKPTYTKTEIGLDNVDNVRQYSTSNPPPYPVIVIPYGDTTYSFAELHEKASSGVVIGVYNSNAYTAWMYAYDNDTIRFDSYAATTRTIISYGSDGTWETRRLTAGSLVKEFYYNQNVSFDDILSTADSGASMLLYGVPAADKITKATGVFAGIDNSTKTAVFIADIANGKRVICKLIDTTWSYEVEDKLTAAIIETALGYTPANANDVPAVDNTLKVTGAAADAAKVGEEISNLSTAIADLLPKNQGEENVGKILVVGSDGNLTLIDMPEGGASGDVTGVFDENNNILLSGNIADGTYELKYYTAEGTYAGAGTLTVSTIVKYTVTQNLTNVTSNYTADSAIKGESFTANLTATDGYSINAITVTMGGVDITSSAVSGNIISIATVTGDIIITAAAEEIVVTPSYTNILTSGAYDIQLNKRWSGSGKAFTGCDGMIAFKIPIADVNNKTIRFKGFPANGQSSSQPPLWMTIQADDTKVGALGGTTNGTGNVWTSTHLVNEGDGVYSIAINSSTMASVATAPTLVITMNVNASAALTVLPDTCIMTIDEEIV